MCDARSIQNESALERGSALYARLVERAFEEALEPIRMGKGDQIGPIGLGWRASTGAVPLGYRIQLYEKGALVLHMLRGMLRGMTQSDDVFIKVMRTFVAEFAGREASTQDFVDTLTKVAPGDWQWFFDQWVWGTSIPTYAWDHEVIRNAEGDTPFAVRVTVEQRGVSEGFRMPVPVSFDFGKSRTGQVVILVDEPLETFVIPVPRKPRSVELNPGSAVLARVKKR